MANENPYSIKKPCANCPFRKEGAIELQEGRVESILLDLINGKTTGFTCHKTIRRFAGKRLPTTEHKQCAGALIALEKMNHQTQLMQVMSRLGVYDPSALIPHYQDVIEAPEVTFDRPFRAVSVTLRQPRTDETICDA